MPKHSILLLFAAFLSIQHARCAIFVPEDKADYTDTTKYFNRTQDTAFQQDPIFVFFAPSLGKLAARRTNSGKAVFQWERLLIDSIVSPVRRQQIYTSLATRPATEPKEESDVLDSLSYGCYRVIIDTVGVDYIGTDTIFYPNPLPDNILNGACNTQILPNNILCYKWREYLTSNGATNDTNFIVDTLKTALHHADTFRAWVFVDTFEVCSIEIPAKDTACEDPVLVGRYYSRIADNFCSSDPYKSYDYYELTDTLLTHKRYPDPNREGRYIKSIKWTTADNVDIYKDAEELKRDIEPNLRTSVYRPLWDAAYKLEIENYFGNKADTISDTIRATAIVARAHISASQDNNEWKPFEKYEDGKAKYDAPLYLRVMNVSVTAHDSIAEWKFYDDNPQDTALTRAPMFFYLPTDTLPVDIYAREHYTYVPGTYPVTMKVTNHFGCVDSLSMKIEVNELLIDKTDFTEVLSPASTKDNLYFKIKDMSKVQSVSKFEVHVLNRYGQLMFSSDDLNFKWDGKIKGTDNYASDGVYFYVCRVEGLNSKGGTSKQKIKGVIHLFSTK
jgi:gliding motility-associated-like protein